MFKNRVLLTHQNQQFKKLIIRNKLFKADQINQLQLQDNPFGESLKDPKEYGAKVVELLQTLSKNQYDQVDLIALDGNLGARGGETPLSQLLPSLAATFKNAVFILFSGTESCRTYFQNQINEHIEGDQTRFYVCDARWDILKAEIEKLAAEKTVGPSTCQEMQGNQEESVDAPAAIKIQTATEVGSLPAQESYESAADEGAMQRGLAFTLEEESKETKELEQLHLAASSPVPFKMDQEKDSEVAEFLKEDLPLQPPQVLINKRLRGLEEARSQSEKGICKNRIPEGPPPMMGKHKSGEGYKGKGEMALSWFKCLENRGEWRSDSPYHSSRCSTPS